MVREERAAREIHSGLPTQEGLTRKPPQGEKDERGRWIPSRSKREHTAVSASVLEEEEDAVGEGAANTVVSSSRKGVGGILHTVCNVNASIRWIAPREVVSAKNFPSGDVAMSVHSSSTSRRSAGDVCLVSPMAMTRALTLRRNREVTVEVDAKGPFAYPDTEYNAIPTSLAAMVNTLPVGSKHATGGFFPTPQ